VELGEVLDVAEDAGGQQRHRLGIGRPFDGPDVVVGRFGFD